MSHSSDVKGYCSDITTGKILSGEYTKKAVKRYLRDLKAQNDEGFPFKFDQEQADMVLDFVESLRLPDMDTDLKLLPWQKFIFYNLFGWLHKSDSGRRRFRKGYVEVARKNGKTSAFLFPLVLYDFLTTKASVTSLVSCDLSQAEESYRSIVALIEKNKQLSELCNCYTNRISMKDRTDTSYIECFSGDTVGVDGRRNSLSIVDEYHQYSSDQIIKSFDKGGRARKNSLTLMITSAGNDISLPCYEEVTYSKSILNQQTQNDLYFCILYEYDQKDNWQDKKNFIKANPSLGTILKEDILEADLNMALQRPSYVQDFKSKTCGIWTNDTASHWIPLEKWNPDGLRMEDVDYKELERIPCFGAFDLSAVNDFTAYTLCWYYKGKYIFKHHFYIPQGQVKEKYKTDNAGILGWIESGYVTATDGETIDYDVIIEDVKKDYQRYQIQQIAYDPYMSKYIIEQLDNELPRIEYVEFGQSLKNMSVPSKDYEKAIYDKVIVDPNPVMTWMVGNAVCRVDESGNYKVFKEGRMSYKRIDGVITSIMSMSLAKKNGDARPVELGSTLISMFS